TTPGARPAMIRLIVVAPVDCFPMWTRRSILAVSLSAGIIAVVAAHEDVRREIQALYDRASSATVAARSPSDVDAIHSWLDMPDCVYTDFGRPPRRWAEQRVYAADELRTPLKIFSNRIQHLEMEGTTAIATTLVTGVARITDSAGRFGKSGG